MNIAKIIIEFPKLPSDHLKDYMVSLGFTRSPRTPRAWEGNLNEKTINFANKINKRYEGEIQAIIKFHDTPPKDLVKSISDCGFIFNVKEKQWYGIKSNLTEALLMDVKSFGSVNFIE
jgi:hypothetical protein